LTDYATLVMQIGEALPQVVVEELQDDDNLQVDASTAEESRLAVASAWRSGAQTARVETAVTGIVGDVPSYVSERT
ncbi:MAG TPA: hypothetical protein VKB39_11460, partial [Candidatus Baltobacteraceae bacterium]|nr:hypothetical protein [Candidatus Baltobacteraceae bacterium]